MSNSVKSWLSPFFRVYVIKEISKTREIKCEKCGVYEGLEMHHTRYIKVSTDEIQILCNKCHRNTNKRLSRLRTEFINGKRYCVVSNHRFEY